MGSIDTAMKMKQAVSDEVESNVDLGVNTAETEFVVINYNSNFENYEQFSKYIEEVFSKQKIVTSKLNVILNKGQNKEAILTITNSNGKCYIFMTCRITGKSTTSVKEFENIMKNPRYQDVCDVDDIKVVCKIFHYEKLDKYATATTGVLAINEFSPSSVFPRKPVMYICESPCKNDLLDERVFHQSKLEELFPREGINAPWRRQCVMP